MSSPPRSKGSRPVATPPADETDAAPAAGKRPPLAERLPNMTDYQLVAYQSSAVRIMGDPQHPKFGAAGRALPLIQKEIHRRATGLTKTAPAAGK